MTIARVKKGDMVQVISGREKGKTGKVLEILTKKERVLVERLNMVKRHMKQKKAGEGGILEKAAPLAWSVVLPLCPKCNKGVRVKLKITAKGKEKEKVRICADCQTVLEPKK